jgi:hypothetical protein
MLFKEIIAAYSVNCTEPIIYSMGKIQLLKQVEHTITIGEHSSVLEKLIVP